MSERRQASALRLAERLVTGSQSPGEDQKGHADDQHRFTWRHDGRGLGAVAADDALVVPTIFDADRKGLREIAAEARALAGKVRDRSITPPELSGGTFSVSNLGMYGTRSFGAIVNSPQAGILAVGEIADKPVVRDGRVVPGRLMSMTLSCDHRILYGAEGAGLLAAVGGLLEEPLALAL